MLYSHPDTGFNVTELSVFDLSVGALGVAAFFILTVRDSVCTQLASEFDLTVIFVLPAAVIVIFPPVAFYFATSGFESVTLYVSALPDSEVIVRVTVSPT